MNTIESILKPITGYLISISRDTTNGWYTLEVGLPVGWVFDDNEEVQCEVLKETDNGNLINIAPKKQEITIDDLVKFVGIIIDTNETIARKEKEFTQKMEDMRERLEEEAKKYYEELDEIKETKFQTASEEFVEELQKPQKKETRGRPKANSAAKTGAKKETRGRPKATPNPATDTTVK